MSLIKRILVSLFTMFLISSSLQASPQLPQNLKWITNDTDEVFASQHAVKGGTFHDSLRSFPLTLRLAGPDSNINSGVRGNRMFLVVIHPNTGNPIPALATHWAYSNDHKTMYFRLNPNARWSDGRKVVAQDYAFTVEFMRKKEIVDPTNNNHFNDEVGEVVIFDSHTISVSSSKPHAKNELLSLVSLNPTPRHFYQDMSDFVKKYNWKITPNTGPYQISDLNKGKSITYSRKKDWWAKDLKYFKNRFNVDKIKYTVIRDRNLDWEYFKKGKLDENYFDPTQWYEKSKGEVFSNGYIKKLWIYKKPVNYALGLWLNRDNPILNDRNVRLGIAYSTNYEKVNKQVLHNDFSRQSSYSEGYAEYADPSIKIRGFNLKKANNYFDLAGWEKWGNDGIRLKDGKRLSVSLTYGYDYYTKQFVVLKEEFKRVGLELVLNKLDGMASYKSASEKKHDIFYGGWGGEEFPEYSAVFHSRYAHQPKSDNYTNTDDPEMDQLIESYSSAVTTKERIKYSRLIDRLIHEQSVWIPALIADYDRIGYWRWLKMPETPGTRIGGHAARPFDFLISLLTSSGGMFWIDEEVKKETLKAQKKGKTFPAETRIDTTYKTGD